MNVTHVFVSYSRANQAEVTQLVQRLRDQGLEVWQDISGERSGIPYSTTWRDQIEEALYCASAAIIVDSPTWRASKVCGQERDLMVGCGMEPKMVMAEDLRTRLDDVVDEVLAWIDSDVKTERNEYRTWIVTRAFRYSRRGDRRALVPRARVLWEVPGLLGELKEFGLVADSFTAPGLANAIRRFVAYARRVILARAATAALAVVLSVAAVPAATIAYQTYNALNESSDAAARAASYASFIRTEAKTDPVYALYLLGSDDALDVFNIEDHFFVMQQAMVALLDTGYPTGFEAASLQDADVAGSPSAQPQADSVPVTFDQKHSSLVIGDAALAPLEFVPVAVEPNVWCVSPDGALLAYASDRLVYVYALGSMTTPSVLYGNSERVTALSIDDAQVHARTESGATVTWERPFLPRMTSRSTTAVENCSMAMGDEGVIVAFVENSHVVISGHGTERSLTLPAGQQPSQRLALSPDGARVAVVTEGDAGMQSVLVMNVADGTVQATASLEHPVIGAAFSNDGSEVALACSDGGGITCVNVADGTVRSSEESGLVGFAVAPYQGGYVLVDAYGTVLVYDADLHVASQMMSLEPIAVPPKQLAIAEDQGLAFVANRGGNSSTGCARLNLGDGSQAIFLLPTNDGMVSNTSVAVSADGALVAFGYPDGTVTVWDARKMNQLCRKSMIAEQVSGLMFSQDGTALHAVGGSGTVYELDVREDLASYDPSDYEATWQRYRDRGAAIRADLEALGLDVSFH